MLNAEKLEALYQAKKFSANTRMVIDRIRAGNPSRATRGGRRNVICRYPSRKMGFVLQAESHQNELAAIYMWEYDPNVYEMYDQPEAIKLTYEKQGKTVSFHHTPDFFVIAEDFVGWVECKTEEDLVKLAKKYPERYQWVGEQWISPPGKATAATVGLEYRIRSSAENDWGLIRNLEFLADYLHVDCPSPLEEQIKQARKLFERDAWRPLRELTVESDQLSSDTVYKLICNGVIYANLCYRPLTDEFAMVFRDEEAFDAYRLQAQGQANKPAALTFDIRVGQQLAWDNKVWEVVAAGKTNVELLNKDGDLRSLNWSAVDEMISDGRITGVSSAATRKSCLQTASVLEMAEAMRRTKILDAARRGEPVNVSDRTLRRYEKRFREAEAMCGKGFEGLVPRFHLRGSTQSKLDTAVLELFAQYMEECRRKKVAVGMPRRHANFRDRCEQGSLTPPSLKTFRKWVLGHRGRHETVLQYEGHRSAYALESFNWHGTGGFPPHGEHPFDVAHIDHTLVDLSQVNPKIENERKRAWLTVMIGARDRVVLSYYLTYSPPSAVSCMMVMRECVRRHGRVPSTIVVDGGKEFHSTYFDTLLAYLEITKKTRPAARPRFGSVMERLFGVANQTLVHELLGNTRLLRDVRKCTATHDPRRLAVWTIETTDTLIQAWLDNAYHCVEHGGLKAVPMEVFKAGLVEFGLREHRRIAYTRDFIIQCLPVIGHGRSMIHIGKGIKHYDKYYWCEAFRQPALERTKVIARYDPFDITRVYAWVDGEWRTCVRQGASLHEHLTDAERRNWSIVEEMLFREQDERRLSQNKVREQFSRVYINKMQSLLQGLR
ncbi:MAG: DDE-type integrase/transposase/recombinase, partial [Chitinimonas sp.]|nr:DDE-type integrase/transposase/recombinase [Chitinimonas sp.]